jgi:hypothetical protein
MKPTDYTLRTLAIQVPRPTTIAEIAPRRRLAALLGLADVAA